MRGKVSQPTHSQNFTDIFLAASVLSCFHCFGTQCLAVLEILSRSPPNDQHSEVYECVFITMKTVSLKQKYKN